MAADQTNDKKDKPDGGAAAAAATTTASTAEKPASADDSRFEVRTPNPGFRGERFGVRFNDGVGYTDDAFAAHELLDLGYAYYDRKARRHFTSETFEREVERYKSQAAAAAARRQSLTR